jgi:serine/threonine-protein kinase CHEK2
VPAILQMHNVTVAGAIEDLYDLKSTLGEGQTAHVLEGICRLDQSRCALKVFRSSSLRPDPVSCDAVKLEIEILRLLPPHWLLVGLREVVATPAAVYLVMELVGGGDLLSPIERRGAFKEAEACRIFAQICEAVTQMHSVRCC